MVTGREVVIYETSSATRPELKFFLFRSRPLDAPEQLSYNVIADSSARGLKMPSMKTILSDKSLKWRNKLITCDRNGMRRLLSGMLLLVMSYMVLLHCT